MAAKLVITEVGYLFIKEKYSFNFLKQRKEMMDTLANVSLEKKDMPGNYRQGGDRQETITSGRFSIDRIGK